MAGDRIPGQGPSLCIQCAKDGSLKAFIQRNAQRGQCGLCGREAPVVSDERAFKPLVNLIRALIRFHIEEWEYNPHFGGESINSILSQDNPILEHLADSVPHDDLTAEGFFEAIFWPPYPPEDDGISIYGGHVEDVRVLVHAIKDNMSGTLQEAVRRLKSENYFAVEPLLNEHLAAIGDRADIHVEIGENFFRARTGFANRYLRHVITDWRSKVLYQPYSGAEIGAPPPALARAGRINREGVSYLYLARSADTAAAEVRPHPGHLVSVVPFTAVRRLQLINFSCDIARFCSSETDLNLFHLLHSIDRQLKTPVVPEARQRYSVTQLVADVIRRQGYDGLMYGSSVGAGENICLFDPSSFAEIRDGGQVRYIGSLKYEIENADVVVVPAAGDHKMPPHS